MILGLEFPPVSHLVEWPDFLFQGNEWFALNKIGLLAVVSAGLTILLFAIAGRKAELVPRGVQSTVEWLVEAVIRDNIVMQTMGPEGLKFMAFLTSMFFFIFFTNIFEVIPGIQMPGNARMANPIFLALLVYVVYHWVGVRSQGLGGYLKAALLPPGVPKAILPLVSLIELVQVLIVRPFSLAVRLFANMLAGHLLLVTFAVLSAALWSKTLLVAVLPLTFATLVALTVFEILVSFLQAFIFTILAAVYIGGSMHPEH